MAQFICGVDVSSISLEASVASVAGRYEPDFIAFKQRLAAQGKPPKVVRIAHAHKLLIRLNAKARDVRTHIENIITSTAAA